MKAFGNSFIGHVLGIPIKSMTFTLKLLFLENMKINPKMIEIIFLEKRVE